MDRDTLLKQAERVEAAQGADRALDAEVARQQGMCLHPNTVRTGAQSDIGFDCVDCGADSWGNRSKDGFNRRLSDPVPNYTGSIDLVIALLPNGTGHDPWWLLKGAWRGKAKAEIWVRNKGKPYRGTASTPALALLAACLRAIAEGEG